MGAYALPFALGAATTIVTSFLVVIVCFGRWWR